MGGSNAVDNIVKLTLKEHLICHLLLTKMTVGQNRYKMVHAANMMSYTRHRNSVSYEKLRKEHAAQMSKRMLGVKKTPEHRENISAGHKGKQKTDTHKENLSKAQIKRLQTNPHDNPWAGKAGSERSSRQNKERCAKGTNPWAGKAGSENSKKICAIQIAEGRHPFQQKHIVEQVRERLLKQVADGTHPFLNLPKLTCHCGKTGSAQNMRRWHFLNCKMPPLSS